MSYKQLSKKEKIIFIWIRHLRFEFIEHISYNGYTNIIDEIIVPIELSFKHKEYKKIISSCDDGCESVKFLNGNHFHIWLFIELKKMVSEIE